MTFTLKPLSPRLAPRLRACVALALAMIGLTAAWAETPQPRSLAQPMADATMQRWPRGQFTAPGKPRKWNYELGTLLQGMDAVWYDTANGAYYRYIKDSIDPFIAADGAISTYDQSAYSQDNVLLGRQLLLLYQVTEDKRYYQAAVTLRKQMASQPRNPSGGFWHKQIYPNQMWLDGLYMAEPFLAEYASVFQQPQDFAEIAKQFSLIEQHTRDPKTGLLYHGWDESKQQKWANPESGASPNFWARGMGWYMMALVDTLPYFPEDDPGRAQLLAILKRTAAAIVRYQDPGSGLWYQVLDKGGEKGNYFESSAACMFTYALARGVRLGYLPAEYSANANKAWSGIQSHFVKPDSDGKLTLTGTVQAIGLGGGEHRDGSYQYYVSSPVVSNDPKGIGAFLLAATEMDHAQEATASHGATVLLDGWYNSQTRKNAAGQTVLFHYKWDDYSNSGFSLFGHIFRGFGAKTKTLTAAPTLDNLKNAHFYVIASPDNPSKTPVPHYMNADEARRIAAWVKQGGVLVMMENDPDNADITHFDSLADMFGLHFNNALTHHVVGNQYDMGRIEITRPAPPFTSPHTLYMKDTCSLSLSKGATPLLQWKGDTLMAMAHYGKGTVVAVTDPWLYNEYTDGRKLPPENDNFAAGREFVQWLIQQK
jgi:unsaturated rhamnogalacturonyl hydrolase